jgi:hypothetical protein
MGLEWKGVCILAQRATIPSRNFYGWMAHLAILYILYNNALILYIFFLCRLKINHVGSYECSFILGSVSNVAKKCTRFIIIYPVWVTATNLIPHDGPQYSLWAAASKTISLLIQKKKFI